MAANWWRSWHGGPTDPKWLAVAQRTQTNAGTVSAIIWSLLDHASQAHPRGSVASFDVESYAAFSGFPAATIQSVLGALRDKNIIKSDAFASWDKRQPKREDGSAERNRRWRERKRTQADVNGRILDKIREDKKDNAQNAQSDFHFLEFYEAYPKKKSKKDAAKAYQQARRDVSHETIMAGLTRIKPTWRDPQYIPYPASWLRAGGWDDQPNVLALNRPSTIPNVL